MALDLVGPQVAAGAGTTLGEVRRKVEAAFGRFALRETPTPIAQREAEGILSAHQRLDPRTAAWCGSSTSAAAATT